MSKILCFVCCLCVGMVLSSGSAQADPAEDVLAMTGARTKVVWVHGVIGKGKNWDANGPEYELMVFDTAEGKPRVLLPGPAIYANPCISPDGERVFYSDMATNTLYTVNWDGSGKKEFTKGYVLCTWINPKDRTQWIYFTEQGYSKGSVVRCRIDDPSMRQLMWSKGQAAHTLTVSADGIHAGGEFPWPLAGVAIFPNVSWKQYGNGCNGSIAPDNSYRFFHMGEDVGHDGVILYDDGGTNRRAISFRASLGADSWAPRWTNDARFIAINSPIGGPGANIYLGRFNTTFTAVEKWVRITDQPGQDAKACGWIDPGLGQYCGEVPLTIEIPANLTPGDGWQFDFGDGAKIADNKHTYTKPGSFTIVGSKANTTLKGWVNAQPRKAPAAAATDLLDESRLQVTFDERVQLRDPKVSLKSGVPVKTFALDGESLKLIIELGGRMPRTDTLLLDGVYDRAEVPNLLKKTIKVQRPAWPVNRTDLVFAWPTAKEPNFYLNATSHTFTKVDLKEWKMARFDRNGAMTFSGGVFAITDGGGGIVSECSKSNQFSIEAVITPFNIYQGRRDDPRRIFGCNGEGGSINDTNFALTQEGAALVLRVRTSADENNRNGSVRRVELCTLADQAPNHVLVTYQPGGLVCYLNGKPAKQTDELKGLLVWRRPRFENGLYVAGREDIRFSWLGKVEGIAVFARALAASDAAADYAVYSKLLAARKVPPQIELRAALTAASETPSPADIAPYRDALVVNEFDVIKIIRGKYKPKKIRVAQWGLVDSRPTAISRAKPGDTFELAVEPFEDHPQLDAEVTHDTLEENFDLDQYVDVTIRPSGAPRLATIIIHPNEIWLLPGGSQKFTVERRDQYGNPSTAPVKWSIEPGGQIDTGTAYGAGNYFDERKLAGDGNIDAQGLFTSNGKPGVVTVVASAADDPTVRGIAIVAVGNWPPINPAGRAPLRFGLDNADGRPFVGDIDRIRIYNRALNADQIAQHAAGQNLNANDGLVGDWTFDQVRNGAYPNAVGVGLAAKVYDQVEQGDENGARFVRLNGKGHLQVAPDARLNFCKAATLEAWVRSRQGGCIISKEIVWSWGFIMSARGDALNLDALRTTTGGLDSPLNFTGNTWAHVVAVLDGGGHWLLYADGKLIGEKKPHTMLIRR